MEEIKKPLSIRISDRMTAWVGSPASLVVHTIFFIGVFGLRLFDIPLDQILLILTTAVSLEAIYLAIFIQMTVNRHTESLHDVEEDIEELGEEMEDLGEDLEELGEEVEDIGEDIEEITAKQE
jgi:low affinity Fe/Cu permease